MKIFPVLSVISCLLVVVNAAGVESWRGRSWHKLFVFGDSFADNGNLPKTDPVTSLSRQWYYPYGSYDGGRRGRGRPTGRFSNYAVQSDVVARMLRRLQAPPAYTRTMKNYCDLSGMTFAVGGAGVYDVPSQAPTLAQQVDSFEKLIDDRTISRWHLGNSVALVAISGNDYERVANTTNFSDIIGFIGNLTTGIAANVQRLQNLGVKKILVNNLHPIGCTPWESRTKNYTDCDAHANLGASIHNSNLKQKLAGAKNVLILDLNTAFTDMVNPAPGKASVLSKQFTHKLEPCCESFDPEGFCGQRDENLKYLYSLCSNPNKYFYWDHVHPTHAGWVAVMKQLEKTIIKFLWLEQ